MPERRVRRVSGQRVATYAGPSVRAPRREKQPQNRTIFARPKTPVPGIPRDTFGIPAATLAGVACPPNSDAKQRGLLLMCCGFGRKPQTPASRPGGRLAVGYSRCATSSWRVPHRSNAMDQTAWKRTRLLRLHFRGKSLRCLCLDIPSA